MGKYTIHKSVAWIATSAAVIAAIYFTKSPWCLWALIVPFLATV